MVLKDHIKNESVAFSCFRKIQLYSYLQKIFGMIYNKMFTMGYVWQMRTLAGRGENFIFSFICNHFFPKEHIYFYIWGEKQDFAIEEGRKEGSFSHTLWESRLSLSISDLRPWPDYQAMQKRETLDSPDFKICFRVDSQPGTSCVACAPQASLQTRAATLDKQEKIFLREPSSCSLTNWEKRRALAVQDLMDGLICSNSKNESKG